MCCVVCCADCVVRRPVELSSTLSITRSSDYGRTHERVGSTYNRQEIQNTTLSMFGLQLKYLQGGETGRLLAGRLGSTLTSYSHLSRQALTMCQEDLFKWVSLFILAQFVQWTGLPAHTAHTHRNSKLRDLECSFLVT